LDIEKPQLQTIDQVATLAPLGGTSLLQLDRRDFLRHGRDSPRGCRRHICLLSPIIIQVITKAIITISKLQFQAIRQAKNKGCIS
jgi:hypothetical protein